MPGADEREIPVPVVKTLFALCDNVCAFQELDTGRGCEEQLTDPTWLRVKAEMAHIRGRRPTSARYDDSYPNPNVFENLILLCPNHHRVIDDLEPNRYTVEVLEAMKLRAEERRGARQWADEATITRLAHQLTVQTKLAWQVEDFLQERADERRRRLAEAINQLPEQAKIVLTLLYYEGLTVEEVGEVLGESTERVSGAHVEALGALRKLVGPDMVQAMLDGVEPPRERLDLRLEDSQ